MLGLKQLAVRLLASLPNSPGMGRNRPRPVVGCSLKMQNNISPKILIIIKSKLQWVGKHSIWSINRGLMEKIKQVKATMKQKKIQIKVKEQKSTRVEASQ